MKDIHDVMTEVGIDYWVDGGTLLGAIRHKGLIPWDGDLDVQFHAQDFNRFIHKAIPILNALGYVYQQPRLLTSQDKFQTYENEAPPSCDIYPAKEINGKLHIGYGYSQALKVTELLPLRLYAFGDLKVWGPHNPVPYLNALYGKNWAKQACQGCNHSFKDESSHSSMVPFNLDQERMRPAIPLGPLQDNRARIQELAKSLNTP